MPCPRAGEAEVFFGRGFDADAADVHAQAGGDVLAHEGDVGRELGRLAEDGGVDVADRVARFAQHVPHGLQQFERVGPFVARVAVREMLADIAEGGRAEQRVGHGVQQHVGVRMAEQAFLIRDVHPAQDQAAALHQAVDVISMSKTHRSFPFQILAGRDLQIGA